MARSSDGSSKKYIESRVLKAMSGMRSTVKRDRSIREPPDELEGDEEEGSLDRADGDEVPLEAVDERVELLGAGAVGVGKEGRAEGSNDGALPGSELKGHGVGREG
jgi:hypothetical protein